MRPADAATVFSFDSEVRRLTPYTGNSEILRSAVSSVVPFGSTCLFDAIVGTARSVQEDSPRARAVVILTDGIDTASLNSAEDAATAAARLDLPVYVLGVGSLAGAAGGQHARGRPRFLQRIGARAAHRWPVGRSFVPRTAQRRDADDPR